MYKFFKLLFDVVSASILLLLISPIFVVIAILVRIKLGSPIFFTQERTGYGTRKFRMIKFRTMTNERDVNGNLLPNEQRFTNFGKMLRSSSLDELPELFNIIKGDMAVIGPRPLPPTYDRYYTREERKRFNVRGGLITPDSLDKSSIISWDKQFQYEASYADNVSFLLDLKILINVFRILVQRRQTNYGEFVRKPLNIERADNKLCD